MAEFPTKVARVLDCIVAHARDDANVLAVALYGSHARGDARPDSDIDVCLMLEPARYEPLALSEKKLEYLGLSDADVQVFQQLPLYIRHRVLKEAKFLFVRDEDRLYELAFRTAQAWEDFRPYYQRYLDEVARG
ncbi:MAG: nucleotidyltransferase domain-containing protein [Nitrospirota bacterium]